MGELAAAVEQTKLACVALVMAGECSLRALARASGVSEPHLSNWITGRRALSIRSADRVGTAIARLSGIKERRIHRPNSTNQVG